MTLICLMLFLTICVLGGGLGINFSFQKMLRELTPVDVNFTDISGAEASIKLKEKGFDIPGQEAIESMDLSALDDKNAQALIARISEFPETLSVAAKECAPHTLCFYLKDLAGDFHAFYNAERVLVDDANVRNARLALLLAARQVLHNGLDLLGVSAPEKM